MMWPRDPKTVGKASTSLRLSFLYCTMGTIDICVMREKLQDKRAVVGAWLWQLRVGGFITGIYEDPTVLMPSQDKVFTWHL